MKLRMRKPTLTAVLAGATLAAGMTTFTFAPVAHAEAPPIFLGSFGTCGTAPGQMQALWGIATGPDGSVYVADETAQRLTKFNGANGQYVTHWAVPNAFDVSVAPDGSVYVLRRSVARIDHYSASGTPLGSFGSPGSGDGQFNDPYGISIDPLGQVFIADTGNDRIQRLAADGTFLGKWGHSGGQIGDLQFATEVAADAFGNVFVADQGNGRIYRFSTAGVVQSWWFLGGPLSTPMTLNYGLAVDPSGNVYVTESDRFVDKYTPTGTWLTRFGGGGTAPGQFQFVMTVATDADGHIFVSDRTLCRITKFGEPPVPALPSTWGRVKAGYR